MTRTFQRNFFRCLPGLASLVLLPHGVESKAESWPVSAAALAHFETKIRPLLNDRCYECHSAQRGKTKGGLALDSAESLRKGGDGGPVVLPGNPAQSRLVQAVRYADEDLRMPPKERLPAEQIADLETWVNNGAVFPGSHPPAAVHSAAAATNHWAFQPVKNPPLPKTENQNWPRDPIDFFILSELEDRRLTPAPSADKRTLIRRATFDLIGLPPTPQEIDAFLADSSLDAFAKVVDRLLASPHFGERWGRHWLDVARYADSNGTENNASYPNAWRYRDYVIDAFNRDKPFAQFIREQIAGDLLSAESEEERFARLTATGFLVLGPKALIEPNRNKLVMDIVDEQIDVVTRAFLGLTVSCARCHDHKFDPISARDYYALAGIFKSTMTVTASVPGPNVPGPLRWLERPLADAKQAAEIKAHQAKITKIESERELARNQKMNFPGNIDSTRLPGIVVDNRAAELTGAWKESVGSTNFVDRNYLGDGNADKGGKSVRFVPEIPQEGLYEVLISYPPFWNRATNVPVTVRFADGSSTLRIDQTKTPDIDRIFVSLGTYRFTEGTNGSVEISNRGTKGFVVADAARFVPVEENPVGAMMPPPPVAMSGGLLTSADLDELTMQLLELRAQAPPPLPSAMAVQEGTVENAQINLRGDPERLGDEVPRGFIAWVTPADSVQATIPDDASGRLQLADWIAGEQNPLTARVAVNRVWLHLFGRGLVDTPDNFGTLSEPPTHPELLDHLARRFVQGGGSTKKLIREIMLSSTYQMSSDHHPAAYAKDPANQYYWRMNRRRLEAEAIRDSILAVSGQLDRTMGGSLDDTNSAPMDFNGGMNPPQLTSNRRSVYLPVLRNNLGDLFQVFDFPDPHGVAGRRYTTTAPTQALFMLNSPFIQEQARAWARALLNETGRADAERVTRAYVEALGRPPMSVEKERVLAFLRSGGAPDAGQDPAAWQHFCHALLASTEFRFVN